MKEVVAAVVLWVAGCSGLPQKRELELVLPEDSVAVKKMIWGIMGDNDSLQKLAEIQSGECTQVALREFGLLAASFVPDRKKKIDEEMARFNSLFEAKLTLKCPDIREISFEEAHGSEKYGFKAEVRFEGQKNPARLFDIFWTLAEWEDENGPCFKGLVTFIKLFDGIDTKTAEREFLFSRKMKQPSLDCDWHGRCTA